MRYFAKCYVASLLVFAGMLCGCQRVEPDKKAVPFATIPSQVDYGLSVYTDGATGCQYLGLYSHGLTPRMASNGEGGTYQMGCKT